MTASITLRIKRYSIVKWRRNPQSDWDACPPPSHSRFPSPRLTRLGNLLALGGIASQKRYSIVFARSPVMSCCGARNFLLALAHKISTAATPYASLLLPLAALGNVPASICLRNECCLRRNHRYSIVPRYFTILTLDCQAFLRKKGKALDTLLKICYNNTR